MPFISAHVKEAATSLHVRRSVELRRQRRMRHARIIHELGWRVTFEAFDQLARDLGEEHVDGLLERFAHYFDRAILKALKVNELPLSPIRAVGGER
jgi:hypothetical protein